jgi:hypothetical protein
MPRLQFMQRGRNLAFTGSLIMRAAGHSFSQVHFLARAEVY